MFTGVFIIKWTRKIRENEKGHNYDKKVLSKEFKLQAVMLILKQQHPVAVVAKKLDIHKTHCTVGFKEYQQHGERVFPGKGCRDFITQSQLKQLEKENKRLKEELEVLKKFQVFLK